MRAAIALGIVAYLAFLVATAPATLLVPRIEQASQGIVRLTDTQGTIWGATARAHVTPRRAAPFSIERITWRWHPSRLIAGEMAFGVEIATEGIAATLEAARGVSTWEVRDVAARGDASRLATWLPLLGTWQPAGPLSLAAPRLAWDGNALRGDLSVEWRGAATALSAVRPLGSYRAEARVEGGPAKLSVTTLEGPLRITGQGTLAWPGRVTFTGEARAEVQGPALEALLGLMGPKRADGAHALDWRAP